MMKKGRRASKLKWEVFGYLGVKINSSEISNGRGLCQKFLSLQNREKTPNFTKNEIAETALSFLMFKRARGGQKIFLGQTSTKALRKQK